ncbi:MAG: DUF3068 domain-containing protein [Desulfobulbaceae bacterium]|nr:DUF3068 domain-containing protein [Desulfobulbaceae bacterium]
MHRLLMAVGLLFVVLAMAWKALVAPGLTMRIPRDWSFHAQYIGNVLYADAQGKLPIGKRLNLYQRDLQVVEWQPERAVISDLYRTFAVDSGEVTWESSLRFAVNPVNGQILSYPGHPEAAGAYYLFPQGADAASYPVFLYDLFLNRMSFHRREELDGMRLNVYRSEGEVDFTELWRDAYVEPGVSGKGDLDRYKVVSFHMFREFWVEPITGEVVHIIEDDPGDYLVNATTGETEHILSVWSGKSTGSAVRHQLESARQRSWQLFAYRVMMPATLLATGIAVLLVSLVLGRRKSTIKTQMAPV